MSEKLCNTCWFWSRIRRYCNLRGVDLLKLKQKVIKQCLEWFIVNEDIAKQVCVKFGYDLEEVS